MYRLHRALDTYARATNMETMTPAPPPPRDVRLFVVTWSRKNNILGAAVRSWATEVRLQGG